MLLYWVNASAGGKERYFQCLIADSPFSLVDEDIKAEICHFLLPLPFQRAKP
jgi:hypothetical protein